MISFVIRSKMYNLVGVKVMPFYHLRLLLILKIF